MTTEHLQKVKERIRDKKWLAYYASMAVILASITYSVVVTWLAFKPVRVIEVFNAPFEMVDPATGEAKNQFNAGDRVGFKVSMCKYMTAQGEITFNLHDTIITSYPVVRTDARKGECPKNFIETSVVLPKNAGSGEYYVSMILKYQINPFRIETYQFETQRFEVIGIDQLLEN